MADLGAQLLDQPRGSKQPNAAWKRVGMFRIHRNDELFSQPIRFTESLPAPSRPHHIGATPNQ